MRVIDEEDSGRNLSTDDPMRHFVCFGYCNLLAKLPLLVQKHLVEPKKILQVKLSGYSANFSILLKW
jgi:hypothetical protein